MRGVEWAAGLFEGEGSIVISYTPNRRVHLTLEMTDEDVVCEFVRIMGGKVYSYPAKQDGWKPSFRWRTSHARKVERALNMFIPYFGERRRAKALEGLECIKGIGILKTHCIHGHPFSPENTAIVKQYRSGKKRRRCRTCHNRGVEAYRARKSERNITQTSQKT